MSTEITADLVLVNVTEADMQLVNQFFETRAQNNSEFGQVDLSIGAMDERHYLIHFDGPDYLSFWAACKNDFESTFAFDFIFISYFEAEAIYFTLRLDDVAIDRLKFSPGRYKNIFWTVLDSDDWLTDSANWVIGYVNKKFKKVHDLIASSEGDKDLDQQSDIAEEHIIEIIKNDNVDAFKSVVGQGLDVRRKIDVQVSDQQFSGGETVFGAAIGFKAVNVVKWILENHSDESISCFTAPLIIAVSNGSAELVKVLLDAQFNVNTKYCGITVLNYAVKKGNYDVCYAILCSKKCNVNLKDNYSDETQKGHPLDSATIKGRSDLVELLLQYPIKNEFLKEAVITACKNKQNKIALDILNKICSGAKSIKISNLPLRAIIFAAENALSDVVSKIIELCPEAVNLIDCGYMPLSMACRSGDIELVKYLITKGADFKCLDEKYCVVFDGKELKFGGGDLYIPIGPTSPMAEAAAQGYLHIVEYLVGLGVDPRISCLSNSTKMGAGSVNFYFNQPVYEIALKLNQHAIVEYLSVLEKSLPKPRASMNSEGDFYSCDLEMNCSCLAYLKAEDLIAYEWEKTDLISYGERKIPYFKKQPSSEEEIGRAITAINECQCCQFRYGGQAPDLIAKINDRKTDYKINAAGDVVRNDGIK